MKIPTLFQETSLFNKTKTVEASVKLLADSITSIVKGTETYTDSDGNTQTSTMGTLVQQTANNVIIQATQECNTASQGGAAVISSLINVATEGIKISAAKVDIEGAAVFTSGRLSQSSLNDAYDSKGSADTAKSEAISAAASDATSKANTAKSEAITAAATDATSKANTAKSEAITAAATDATTKANTAKSEAITAAASDATSKANTAKSEAISAAASDAASKYSTKDAAVTEEQYIYIQATSGTNSVNGTTTWVTSTAESVTSDAIGLTPAWTTKRPTYRSNYPVIFVAKQRKTVSGIVTCSTPIKDDTLTIIDGGHITTGTIDASKATITNINASNITSGTLAAARIDTAHITVGSLQDGSSYAKTADVPTKTSDLTNDSGFETTTGAQSKANTAKSEAITAAASDATSKANTAKSEAISAAASDATTKANAVNTALESYKTTTNTTLTNLQNQVDGQIEAWYKNVDPTTSNDPASSWNTDALKARHVGDLYYNVSNGHSWRWMQSGSLYTWQQIPDSDAAAALSVAQNAQNIANSKRRIFTTTPIVPYDVGDLWVSGSEVKYCSTSKTSQQTYASSDWTITATDDTLAQAAKSVADAAATPTDVATAKSEAITAAASDATSKANTAKSEAITAAATDATSKANTAKSEAITAAATDATTKANAAAKTATDYITVIDSNGIKVHASNNPNTNYSKIDADGLNVIKNSVSVAKFGETARVGKLLKSYVEIGVNANDNGYIDMYNSDVQLCHIGYDPGINASGGTSLAPYYNFGTRKANTSIGNYSCVLGTDNTASGYSACSEGSETTASGNYSHAEGYKTSALGNYSHAEGSETTASVGYSHAEGRSVKASNTCCHAEGYSTEASGEYSHAEGYFAKATGKYSHAEGSSTTASGQYSHAAGRKTIADKDYMTAVGAFNKDGITDVKFVVGNGASDSNRQNALTVIGPIGSAATVYIKGSSSSHGEIVTSDARVKTLIDELSQETSIDFITKLKPKHYYKEDVEEYGFYAQEVEKIPEFGNVLVTRDNSGIYDLPDYRLLNYQGMIAPMVSVEQNLIERVEKLEKENGKLKEQIKHLIQIVENSK